MAALAVYDFGTLFREIRAHTGWSQQTLGNLIDLDQSRISAIERGSTWLCDVRIVARIALLGAQVDSELRPRLMIATARLATQAGWMSFEVQQHDAARRLWMIALDLTRHAEHPQGSDLTVFLLYDMAIQAVHLGRPDEALQLVQIGHGAAAGKYPVLAPTACCLANIQARAYAARGDAVGCERALGQAVEQFSSIDLVSRAPWGAWLDETGLAALQSAAHYTLALTGRDPRAAGRAVPLLRHAVDHFGPDYARPRGLMLPDLAGSYALAGDVGTAVTVGHQAVDAVSVLSSPRAYDRLQILNTALEPLHTSPGVTDLRDRITATAA